VAHAAFSLSRWPTGLGPLQQLLYSLPSLLLSLPFSSIGPLCWPIPHVGPLWRQPACPPLLSLSDVPAPPLLSLTKWSHTPASSSTSVVAKLDSVWGNRPADLHVSQVLIEYHRQSYEGYPTKVDWSAEKRLIKNKNAIETHELDRFRPSVWRNTLLLWSIGLY
jgi:hypothetical protein